MDNINAKITHGSARVRVKIDDLGLRISIAKRIIPDIPENINEIPHYNSLNEMYSDNPYIKEDHRQWMNETIYSYIDLTHPFIIIKGHLVVRLYPDRYTSFILRKYNEYASHVLIIGKRLQTTNLPIKIEAPNMFYYTSTDVEDVDTCMLALSTYVNYFI